MATKTVLEKLQTAVENARIGASTLELLGELSDVREWAEALADLADNIENVESAIQDYIDCEGDRDEKADAKDTAITSLEEMIESWEAADRAARCRRAGEGAVTVTAKPARWKIFGGIDLETLESETVEGGYKPTIPGGDFIGIDLEIIDPKGWRGRRVVLMLNGEDVTWLLKECRNQAAHLRRQTLSEADAH